MTTSLGETDSLDILKSITACYPALNQAGNPASDQ